MSVVERLRSGLAHAFAVDPGEPVSAEEHELVRRLARVVVQRRMTAPAVLALETARPLTFLGSQVLAFFGPMITVAVAPQDHERLVHLLERRGSVDLLIDSIIEQENQRSG